MFLCLSGAEQRSEAVSRVTFSARAEFKGPRASFRAPNISSVILD